MIETRGLTVALNGCSIVQDVTMMLGAGQFVALIGPNGAGKTTLLRALGGLTASTGDILLDGRQLADLSHRERARLVAYLPQGHAVHWPLPARDVVALGLYPLGLNDPARMTEEQAARVEEAMRRTDTLAFADRRIDTLSGGERARIMLARVLVTGARIVLADEPTAALDPRHQLTIMSDLREEARRGALVIAVTHDLGLAARMADHVLLMHRGHLAAQGAPAALLSERWLADVYGVTAYRTLFEDAPVIVPWGLSS